MTFDALKYAKQLEASGVPALQAKAFVNAQREILAEAIDITLATKVDIREVRSDLALLDSKVDKLSWMMGILIALAVANFAKQFF